MWQVYVFNLVAALLIAGWYLRAVRRLERRMDERLRRFTEWADAAEAKLDKWADEEETKYDIARDEIRVSLREQVDKAIAEMRTKASGSQLSSISGTANLSFGATATSSATATVSPPAADQVPTEDEIRKLPRWAQVAFAARCARRVLPLVRHHWVGAPEYHSSSLGAAISVAERVAATTVFDPAAYAAADAGAAGASVASETAAPAPARAAVSAATSAFIVAQNGAPRGAADARSAGAFLAADAARAAAGTAARPTEAIRRDFETVRGLALANGWTDDTPVPPSYFGPLWPDGPPEGWPKSEKPTTDVVLEFDVPDDMTTADAVELMKELATALCELHLAGGGHGLAIQPPLEITAPALVPAGSSR